MGGEAGRSVKIHIENVKKEYVGDRGTTVALNGVNLDILENEFVCVVGPSGCGKSTLLAAESTGAQAGLGMRIRMLASTFESDAMLLYILIIGLIGPILNVIVDFIERRLTSWAEKREDQ